MQNGVVAESPLVARHAVTALASDTDVVRCRMAANDEARSYKLVGDALRLALQSMTRQSSVRSTLVRGAFQLGR